MCLSRVDCFVGLNWFTTEWKLLAEEFWTAEKNQGHPTDRFGGISVRKTCNRLKFSVREMSSRAFLIKIN